MISKSQFTYREFMVTVKITFNTTILEIEWIMNDLCTYEDSRTEERKLGVIFSSIGNRPETSQMENMCQVSISG